MISLLELVSFDEVDLNLWGGYGSANEAIFMIGQTTDLTNEIARRWQTQQALDNRNQFCATEYLLQIDTMI